MAQTELFAPFAARILWPDDPGPMPAWKARLYRVGRIAYAVVRDVATGTISLHAGSLVYTTILSLVPILALAFSVLKGFGVHYRFEPLLYNALAPLGPQAKEVADNILDFVDRMNVGVLGTVGLAVLFYTAISVVQKVEAALNEIWRVGEHRSLSRKFTDYLSILLIGPVLLFSLLGVTTSVMASEAMQNLTSIRTLGLVVHTALELLPIVLVIAAFTFLYAFVPNTRVPLVSALIGSTCAAALWMVAGEFFGRFVASATSYTAIYSALAALILFFIWLNVSWTIVLTGAAVAFYHAHPENLLPQATTSPNQRTRERVGVLVAGALTQAAYAGERAPSTAELAGRIGIAEGIIDEVLQAFSASGLVAATRDEPPRWLPARPPDVTPASVLIRSLRTQCGQDLALSSVDPVALDVEARMDHAIDTALGEHMLKDVAFFSASADERTTPVRVHPAQIPQKAGTA